MTDTKWGYFCVEQRGVSATGVDLEYPAHDLVVSNTRASRFPDRESQRPKGQKLDRTAGGLREKYCGTYILRRQSVQSKRLTVLLIGTNVFAGE